MTVSALEPPRPVFCTANDRSQQLGSERIAR
jgi:hypothetical protein